MTRVKLCGFTREIDVRTAVEAGVDAVGAVVDVPVDTPREVRPERAARLFDAAPPFVTTTLVTMPDSPEDAAALCRRLSPDVLQVHTELPAGDLAYLAGAVDAALLPVVGAGDLAAARRYDGVADALLVDSTDADGGGGTGRTHDWDATRRLADAVDAPVVLAGGLDPSNVAEAVRTADPYGVDVASGVEREGGVKDPDAVEAFVRAARTARDDAGDRDGVARPEPGAEP